METQFKIGDRVRANPATWLPTEQDQFGRGVGIGIIVVPPFFLEPEFADVRWVGDRSFEHVSRLLPA